VHRSMLRSLVVSCLGLTGIARAGNGEVVTNPAPALAATMSLTGSDANCFYWSVSGKVSPAYRGYGANVTLVCQPYSGFGSGGSGVTFGRQPCDTDFCPGNNVDACGNFSFPAQVCGSSPQFAPDFVCNFIVHVDGTATPQACSGRAVIPDGPPQDPNGSAPCSGGLCPTSP
jgi:hypothetical protein